MRIFVTGGSGYIGRAVLAELCRRGHHVAALARSDAAAATVRAQGAEPIHGGLDSLDVIELAAREHDATIYIAAPVPPDGVAREAQALDVLLRVAPSDHAIVYTSGTWVYGDRGDAVV
ncbi:MAG TPA: NAD(P)H-binding protein, partial [Candidatus Lustribacter sp.]